MITKHLILVSLVSIVLTGCGGGSGDSGGNGGPSGALVDAETGDLKNAAAGTIGGSFDGNLSAVGKMLNRNSDVLTGTLGDVVAGGTEEFPTDIETDAEVQNTVQSLVRSSLAASDTGDSTTSRDGNSISVDPDEDELCRDDSFFGASEAEDIADCKALLKDLTVELLATSEEAGVLTYNFKQQPVLRLGYAPNSESVELDFGGLRTLLNEASIISTGQEALDLPSTMTGSIRSSTITTNTEAGKEAGSVSLEIVNAIQFEASADGTQTDLSMAPGTLFSVSADVGTGQGAMSFDVGAIAAAGQTDDGLARLNLAGFTGSADVNPESGTLVVRNFGLSKGPFSLSVNNEEVMKATLGAFGFRVTEGSDLEAGELIIDGNMDLSIILGSFAELDLNDELTSAVLSVMAPSTTSFARAGNGATKIGGAGPFSVSLSSVDSQNQVTESSFIVNSGECFNDLSDEEGSEPSAAQCL